MRFTFHAWVSPSFADEILDYIWKEKLLPQSYLTFSFFDPAFFLFAVSMKFDNWIFRNFVELSAMYLEPLSLHGLISTMMSIKSPLDSFFAFAQVWGFSF